MSVHYALIEDGQRAADRFTLDRSNVDWAAIAKGCGAEPGRAPTLDESAAQFKRGLDHSGPYLAELAMQLSTGLCFARSRS